MTLTQLITNVLFISYINQRVKREVISYTKELTNRAQTGKPFKQLHETHPYGALQTIWTNTIKEISNHPRQSAYQTFIKHQDNYNDRLALHNNSSVQEALKRLENMPSLRNDKTILYPYYQRAGVDFKTNQPRYESHDNNVEELLRLIGRTASF